MYLYNLHSKRNNVVKTTTEKQTNNRWTRLRTMWYSIRLCHQQSECALINFMCILFCAFVWAYGLANSRNVDIAFCVFQMHPMICVQFWFGFWSIRNSPKPSLTIHNVWNHFELFLWKLCCFFYFAQCINNIHTLHAFFVLSFYAFKYSSKCIVSPEHDFSTIIRRRESEDYHYKWNI